MACPTTTSRAVDDAFWSPDGIHWDAHRIGWAVAGSCAALTALITLFTLTMHATHYQHPPAQRQVMRVLLMPPVYAITSFFSYRYYTEYEYYILAETAYEAITLSAFLMLLMELVSMGTDDQQIASALAEKDKMKFPFPFNFWRFRASKPYFWHALSFSVMQYVVLRPLISIIGIICQYFGVLCPEQYSPHFAEVYLDAVDFVSISVALYGLIVFYVLCKGELKGRKPLSKFLAIKLIVFFTFYQTFLFSILQSHGVIKATAYWTATNVSDGLSALCTCVEMVIFSIYMGWAYNWTDYTDRAKNPRQRETGFKTYCQAIWDTINLADFFVEIYLACKFFVDYMRGVPGTHSSSTKLQRTFMPDSIGDAPQELSKFHGPKGYNDEPTVDAFTPPPKPIRSPSGNVLYPSVRSPGSYQRLQEEQGNVRSDLEEAPIQRRGVSATSPQKSAGTASFDTAYQKTPPSEQNQNQFAISEQNPYSPGSGGTASQYQTPRTDTEFPNPYPTGASQDRW
ncbi:hypothetical protein IAR55_000748 [Kwoniella newhampshirensis]|uniref:DUF300-domain-containing protein n=1 Tax=Kwoniella newhampshirensis TaxID=1651941 RepID=A0AAW0Z3Y9_9TREE